MLNDLNKHRNDLHAFCDEILFVNLGKTKITIFMQLKHGWIDWTIRFYVIAASAIMLYAYFEVTSTKPISSPKPFSGQLEYSNLLKSTNNRCFRLDILGLANTVHNYKLPLSCSYFMWKGPISWYKILYLYLVILYFRILILINMYVCMYVCMFGTDYKWKSW